MYIGKLILKLISTITLHNHCWQRWDLWACDISSVGRFQLWYNLFNHFVIIRAAITFCCNQCFNSYFVQCVFHFRNLVSWIDPNLKNSSRESLTANIWWDVQNDSLPKSFLHVPQPKWIYKIGFHLVPISQCDHPSADLVDRTKQLDDLPRR